MYLVFVFFKSSFPVTAFSEVAQSDTTEHASQSVPMVSTSTPGLVVPGAAGTGEERDDVFLEPDTDRLGSLLSRVCHHLPCFPSGVQNMWHTGCWPCYVPLSTAVTFFRQCYVLYNCIRSHACCALVSLFQVQCRSVTGPSGLAGRNRRAKPTI